MTEDVEVQRARAGDIIAKLTGLLGIKQCAPCKKRQAAMNKVDMDGSSLVEITTGLWAAATRPEEVLDGEEENDRAETGSTSEGKSQTQNEAKRQEPAG